MSTKGTIRNFDVDFAHCDCKGTKHAATAMQVIPVQWKRTDKDPNGRVRFQCQRCKKSWSMNNIRSAGEGRIQLTAPHPDEIKRRRKIHPDYDMLIAVNL